MPSTVEKLSPSRVKLTIEIPFATSSRTWTRPTREIAQSVNIPGFRKGKVPAGDHRPALRPRRRAAGGHQRGAAARVLAGRRGAKAGPAGRARGRGHQARGRRPGRVHRRGRRPSRLRAARLLDADGDRGRRWPRSTSEVDERIEVMRQRFATRIDVDRAAAEGDVVTIDLEATAGRRAARGRHAPRASPTRSARAACSTGLDEAVTGLKAGDEVDFTSDAAWAARLRARTPTSTSP